MQETWVQSLGREDPLEKKMAVHSSILAWEILLAETSGRLQSWGSKSLTHLVIQQQSFIWCSNCPRFRQQESSWCPHHSVTIFLLFQTRCLGLISFILNIILKIASSERNGSYQCRMTLRNQYLYAKCVHVLIATEMLSLLGFNR